MKTKVRPVDPRLGRRIAKARTQAGLSVRALAAACAMSYPHLNRIERAKTDPCVTLVRKIADRLGKPITWFFEEENNADAAMDLHL